MSSSIGNLWNYLCFRFNTHTLVYDIHPDAAVNVQLGWPVFIQQIQKESIQREHKKLSILDYGCGVGGFCTKPHSLGYHVVGIDISEKMLELAKQNSPNDVVFIKCDLSYYNTHSVHELLLNKYDVITSIHCFDWIEDIEILLDKLCNLLTSQGIIIFAVFPEDHIRDSIKIRDLFEDFDSTEKPGRGYANFDGVRIPVYVKTPSWYDSFFLSRGFLKVLEYYPVFSDHFLNNYSWQGSLSPEMVILAYRKGQF